MDQIGPIELDSSLTTPLYQQLFDAIVALIEAGALVDGHRLPPTRGLARQLGAHRNTVVRAYRQLEETGFVSSTVGRGTFVRSRRVAPPAKPAAGKAGISWSTWLSRQSAAEPLRRAERFARESSGYGAVNLMKMQPAPELLPDALFKRCLDHVLTAHGAHALGYTPRGGARRLREQIALDLARQGVSTTSEDVLVTAGSQQALDLLARTLLDPGDGLIVNCATYTGAMGAFAAAGARFLPVTNDDEGPELDALERLSRAGAKAFYLMPSCQNPTGACVSLGRRKALVEWSRRSGIPLIEDDYAADLHLDAPPPSPLRGFDGDVIYVGTYSKKLIPALRVGYVVAPRVVRERLESLRAASDMGGALLVQLALAEFLERGYLKAHLTRLLDEYRLRRDALEQALHTHLPQGVRWHRPVQGLNLWLPLPEHVDSHAVFEIARDEGVLVMPGSMNRAGEPTDDGVRLTFCAEPPARLSEGGQRLGRAIERALASERVETEVLETSAVI